MAECSTVSPAEGQFSQVPTSGAQAAKPEIFRSPVAPVIWWAWLVFAVANLVDLAVQGRDHFSAVVATVLVLITGVAYVTAFRPRILAGRDLRIHNPLRDHWVSWACVTGVDLGDSLQVHCQWQEVGGIKTRTLYGWAVHSPRRSRLKAEVRARRRTFRSRPQTGYAQLPPEAKTLLGRSDAESITALLERQMTAAREGDVPATRPVSSWHWPSVAALVVPVILVTVVSLI